MLRLTRALCCAAPLALLLAGPAQAQEPTPREQERLALDASERASRRDATVRAVERVGPAVANLSILKGAPPSSWKTRRKGSKSLGSALVIDAAGYLVTSAHVLSPGARILVRLPGRAPLVGHVVATAPEDDLALLRVRSSTPLPTARLALSNRIFVGETAIALGNPYGLANSVTRGVVSALKRKIKSKGRTLRGTFLQTDAAINPGNSGGPLVNLLGEVIGINTAIHATGQGIGFALPVRRLRAVLIRLSDPARIRGLDPGLSGSRSERGLRVSAVARGGAAWRAGLRVGDRIDAAGARQVRSTLVLNQALLSLRGGALRVALLDRQGRRRGAVLRPGAPAWRAGLRDLLGVELQRSQISRVRPGSPAARLGLKAGDRIVRVRRPGEGSRRTPNPRTLWRALEGLPSRARVGVVLVRRGQELGGILHLR